MFYGLSIVPFQLGMLRHAAAFAAEGFSATLLRRAMRFSQLNDLAERVNLRLLIPDISE